MFTFSLLHRNICTKRAAAATATYGLLSLTTAVEGFSFSSGIGSQDRHCRSRPCGTSVPRIRTAVSPTATMCAPGGEYRFFSQGDLNSFVCVISTDLCGRALRSPFAFLHPYFACDLRTRSSCSSGTYGYSTQREMSDAITACPTAPSRDCHCTPVGFGRTQGLVSPK